tara:strand:- start:233 stop:442 length:210 start_codon:yes stop_codon:yes gene_type:complete
VVAAQANHIAHAFAVAIAGANLLLAAGVAAQNADTFDANHQALFVGFALTVVLTRLRRIILNALFVFAA